MDHLYGYLTQQNMSVGSKAQLPEVCAQGTCPRRGSHPQHRLSGKPKSHTPLGEESSPSGQDGRAEEAERGVLALPLASSQTQAQAGSRSCPLIYNTWDQIMWSLNPSFLAKL